MSDQVVHDRLARLEERLAALEDEREIRELLSRYGHYADAALDDDYYGLLTDDTVMDVSSGYQPDPYAVLRWEGLEQMKEFMTERSGRHGSGFVGRSLHVQGNNVTVTVSGPTATATSYSFILQQVGAEVRLVSASVNQWRLRKVQDRWRIAERKRRMVGAPDTADILGPSAP